MIFKSKTLFLVIKEQNPQTLKLFLSCRDFVKSFVIFLDWTIHSNLHFVLNHLGVAREMFEMCSVYNFTKWTHEIVVGKSSMMKLRKIDTDEMENELACDSND